MSHALTRFTMVFLIVSISSCGADLDRIELPDIPDFEDVADDIDDIDFDFDGDLDEGEGELNDGSEDSTDGDSGDGEPGDADGDSDSSDDTSEADSDGDANSDGDADSDSDADSADPSNEQSDPKFERRCNQLQRWLKNHKKRRRLIRTCKRFKKKVLWPGFCQSKQNWKKKACKLCKFRKLKRRANRRCSRARHR